MKALKTADLPVLITVWLLCVGTDWSTGTKIALNVIAVALLCAKEVAVHRRESRRSGAAVRRSPAHRLAAAA
ncbi:hypothetical protein LJ753_01995 [Arthrobacter sp. zg-Y20]|uniref:hypothetical protein n=1 Tax=unclassified Arthrobacter TaxID=235627 RepID=UPI001D158A9D|nr:MULTISPECIES: hypothetical protein [unclassified Arthrobacter]MCC3274642.1 hypothetical protein [Arthrobacter sp. zg-Y20]MDK1314799.1 hypothetical protein [Arthrobacter sp. zg.Y20]WIB04663.1 hypothetical protein QNO06_08745 [Arthrobacter sp. zg-Y20]